MSIDIEQYIKCILRPTLEDIDMYSVNSEILLLGTFAQESQAGTFVTQIGGGPGLGFYQEERNSFIDIVNNYLKFRPTLVDKICSYLGYTYFPEAEHLMHDLKLQVIIARLHYKRVPYPLPEPEDLEGMAKYWKLHYNSLKGKGTEVEFLENFNRLIAHDYRRITHR